MRLFAALLLCAAAVAGQDPPPPVAIVGARIVVDPDKTIEAGTVVVRDGRIEAVGPQAEVAVPPAAEVIDGKGLTVYAGFIDARSTVGLPATARTEEQRRAAEGEAVDFARDALAAMESANRKGVRPDLEASNLVAPSDADLKKWHAGGFAAAVVAAGDEYWAGRGALVSLSGRARRSILVLPRCGLYASFRSYGEGYPVTRMGAIAHLRQTLLDAAHYREQHRAWAAKPEGRRPPVDPALDALGDVLDRQARVFFEVNSPSEIGQALAIADEFGFPVGISGGAEAWKAAPELKKRGVPVLLSLKWPKEPKDEKSKDPDAIEDEHPARLREHRKAEWEDRVRCALRLHDAGVAFAFTTQGIGPSDLFEKAQMLVERGLPRAAAVRSLTSAPAGLFRAEAQLGTIAPGLPANLTVLEGQLGDKKVKVKYVLADGRKFEVDKKGGPPEIDVSGGWSVQSKDREFEATLDLKQTGADVKGTIKAGAAEGAVTGRVTGRSVQLTATAGDATYEFAADMKQKKLTGTFSGPGGKDIDFSATRPE